MASRKMKRMTEMEPEIEKETEVTKTTKVAHVVSGSVRGEELVNAIDTAMLEDVLKRNGEEHLFDKIMELSVHVEDDPPVIFGWQNVEEFVRAIQTARAQAVAPDGVPLPADPLGLPAALTVQNFKEALLDHVTIPGAAARLDTTCLPCSLAQCGQVAFVLRELDLDPWIRRIVNVAMPNMLPIAFVYVPRPRSHTLDRVTPPRPGSLWG
jgi:hypothetical protein